MQALATTDKSKNSSAVAMHNRKKQSFFAPLIVQPKLTIGASDDSYEREADAMAEKIMGNSVNSNGNAFFAPVPVSSVQRKCAHCEEEEKLQRKTEGGGNAGVNAPSTVNDVVNSGGQPLSSGVRKFFEPHFSRDFSNVRIHNNASAASSAQQINALAYTTGNDIVFNQNQFSPESHAGKKLLAHELTHVAQQGEKIRRMPNDRFGKPLGFVSTPEQEAYDKETAEIKEWEKALERLGKGELDDRDLTNYRLRNRLTGLTTTDINALIPKIQNYQKQNPALSTSHITEWLEVRKEISTPMPDGATVDKDPITNTIDSYSVTIGKVKVKVLTDAFGKTLNDTGPVSSFGRSYRWTSKDSKIVTGLFDKDSGTEVPVNPTSFEITIQTNYLNRPDDPSGYGKGTQVYDKEEKTTSLRVHEGNHGSDYLNYIRNNPFPVDISKGVVGVLTVAEMRKIDAYISGITKATCEATDQVGFTQDEFLKTAEGKRSGITSCRK